MTERSLAGAGAGSGLSCFERLAAVGDSRRGSISENWRRCGKPIMPAVCCSRGSRGGTGRGGCGPGR